MAVVSATLCFVTTALIVGEQTLMKTQLFVVGDYVDILSKVGNAGEFPLAPPNHIMY
jgi:hypothetical protein